MFFKISLFFLLLVPFSGFAKHLRGGEISYKPVPNSPFTYEITVTIYTNVGPATPDIPDLISGTTTFSFGDNLNITSIPRSNGTGELLTSTIKKNVYTVKHTYPGNGIYIISLTAVNRNTGILNIPNSDSQAMYIASMLTISDIYSPISSPTLSFSPLDEGCINQLWTENPGAFDSDGDILKYRLIKCKTSGGDDIPGYKFPQELDLSGTSTFTIDSLKGTINWDSPTSLQGDYNIAIKIEIWRNNKLIGYVIRDWDVLIKPCADKPPMQGFAVPNAFEPENTKDVDLTTFKPKAVGLKTFYMGIWDLWGNLIWSTNKVNSLQEPFEGWNGNDSKGRKMPSQNYIWRMNATFTDGAVWKGVKDHFGNFHKEGTFTLLR
jgi:hypothetical protein